MEQYSYLELKYVKNNRHSSLNRVFHLSQSFYCDNDNAAFTLLWNYTGYLNVYDSISPVSTIYTCR